MNDPKALHTSILFFVYLKCIPPLHMSRGGLKNEYSEKFADRYQKATQITFQSCNVFFCV